MEQTTVAIPTEAGQIYFCGKGRYRRVEQVRETGQVRNGAGGLKYALVRVCGPKGRTHDHPFLGGEPITVFLLPNGTMPRGYELHRARQSTRSPTMKARRP
jgi:hypothetical protein